MPIKVIIADDHQLFRQGLVNMLSEIEEIAVLAEACNGQEAIDLAAKHSPNIILMDIGMPEISGVEATRYIRNHFPETKVVALTMHADRNYIKTMLEEGASGYLLKNCTYGELTACIKQVAKGKKYLDSDATGVLVDTYIGNEEEPVRKVDPKLSDREFEVLKLYAEGKSTKEISEELFISVKTVGTHRQNILEKLELRSTADIVKYALRKGIIKL